MKTNLFVLFRLFLAFSLLTASTAAVIPVKISGSWKILKIHTAAGKLNIQSADMTLTFKEEKDKGIKLLQVTSTCRGLEFSQPYEVGNNGKIYSIGDRELIVRTAEIRPCDLKRSKEKKALLEQLRKMNKGKTCDFKFNRNGKFATLKGDGFSLKMKKIK